MHVPETAAVHKAEHCREDSSERWQDGAPLLPFLALAGLGDAPSDVLLSLLHDDFNVTVLPRSEAAPLGMPLIGLFLLCWVWLYCVSCKSAKRDCPDLRECLCPFRSVVREVVAFRPIGRVSVPNVLVDVDSEAVRLSYRVLRLREFGGAPSDVLPSLLHDDIQVTILHTPCKEEDLRNVLVKVGSGAYMVNFRERLRGVLCFSITCTMFFWCTKVAYLAIRGVRSPPLPLPLPTSQATSLMRTTLSGAIPTSLI